MEIIAPTMNHYPRNGWEGEPEFSTTQVSNPSIQDLFICDTSTKSIVSPINKPHVYAGNRVGLDYFLIGLNASSTLPSILTVNNSIF